MNDEQRPGQAPDSHFLSYDSESGMQVFAVALVCLMLVLGFAWLMVALS